MQVVLGSDCTVAIRPAFTVAKGKTYAVTFDMNTENGVFVTRIATIRGT